MHPALNLGHGRRGHRDTGKDPREHLARSAFELEPLDAVWVMGRASIILIVAERRRTCTLQILSMGQVSQMKESLSAMR